MTKSGFRRSLDVSSVQNPPVFSEESREDDKSYQTDRSEYNGLETRDGKSQIKDYGIELVLTTTTDRTSDTQRAQDMIVQTTSRAYKQQKGKQASNGHYRNQRSMLMGPSSVDEPSLVSTERSIESRTLESLFQPDQESRTSSKASAVKHQKSTFRSEDQAVDDAWTAAKRGDLAALKRFHRDGKTDWVAQDEFSNIPLYYACHSGAIVDINVVHFLLWVTPIKDRSVLEKCSNRKNKAVMNVVDAFVKGSGYSSPLNDGSWDSIPLTQEPSATPEVSAAVVKDDNKIPVSPSKVAKKTAHDDERSVGSMFSFKKRRDQKKATGTKLKSKGFSSKDSQAASMWHPTVDSTLSINDREECFKSRSSPVSSSRIVSFDHHKEPKKTPRKHGQLSHCQSPREKLRLSEYSDDSHPPNIEFQDKELRWKIENHIAIENNVKNKVVLTIHVGDSRQRVFISNCHGVSVQIHGRKMKSLLVSDCSDVSVVFETVSHASEIVHCKNVAIQTTGICPTFALERSRGITVWLSNESKTISNIVTSSCTGVNVSLPRGPTDDDNERTELLLPERYVHHFSGGEVKSRVCSVCR